MTDALASSAPPSPGVRRLAMLGGLVFSSLSLLVAPALGLLAWAVLLLPWIAAAVLVERRIAGDRGSPWGAYLLGALTPWIVLVALGVAWTLAPSVEAYFTRQPFDAEAWRAAAAGSTDDRLHLVDDLLDSGRLDGKRRAEVEALLGPSEGTRWRVEAGDPEDSASVYGLGRPRGFFRFGSALLVIEYGEDGMVRESRIRHVD